MEMNIETIPSCSIAYIRRTGPYGSGNRETMEKIKKWARESRYLHDRSVFLGIPRDNPGTTKPEECRYDTCLVLPENTEPVEGEILKGTLPGGKYAVFRLEHTAEALAGSWRDVFSELESHSCQPDESRAVMERYRSELVAIHQCEICIPIL